MKISLQDQVILLTGASRGIGKGIASLLRQTQATVAVHYGRSKESAEALASEIGNGSLAFQADLSQPLAARQLAHDVMAHYGRVDGLVNNAGIAFEMEEEGDFDTWVDQWEQTLHVNLLAAAVLCRELIPHFIQHGGGRIVHISSRAAFRGDTTAYMAYAASKGGMVSLSRSIARGYGKQGIKSFVVAPGFIQTEMAQQFIDVYGEQFVRDDLALDTLTQPKDLAPTVVFLLSGWMDHATGCTIDVNAGSYVH
ncbi:MAG: SDR family oxidoreductase [Bacteroidota bacterium]